MSHETSRQSPGLGRLFVPRNFWIEPACWDILGQQQGQPVYELLGGKPRAIDVVVLKHEGLELKAQRDARPLTPADL